MDLSTLAQLGEFVGGLYVAGERRPPCPRGLPSSRMSAPRADGPEEATAGIA
jgi:hypothetical protein